MDDSSVNFHDKVFLHFLPNFFKKWRKILSWKFTDELSVKYLRIHKWGRWIRPKTISEKASTLITIKKQPRFLIYLRWPGYLHTYILKMRSLLAAGQCIWPATLSQIFFCFYAFSSSTRFKSGHNTVFYFTNFALLLLVEFLYTNCRRPSYGQNSHILIQ